MRVKVNGMQIKYVRTVRMCLSTYVPSPAKGGLICGPGPEREDAGPNSDVTVVSFTRKTTPF